MDEVFWVQLNQMPKEKHLMQSEVKLKTQRGSKDFINYLTLGQTN